MYRFITFGMAALLAVLYAWQGHLGFGLYSMFVYWLVFGACRTAITSARVAFIFFALFFGWWMLAFAPSWLTMVSLPVMLVAYITLAGRVGYRASSGSSSRPSGGYGGRSARGGYRGGGGYTSSEPKFGTDTFNALPFRRTIGAGRAYGMAADNVSGGGEGTFGADATKFGVQGELAVAAVIEKVIAKHGGVVAHGVNFKPGSATGTDVDHMVIGNGFVLLVDAKFWKYGTYSWASDGSLLRDGAPFAGSNVKMASAVELWQKYLELKLPATYLRVSSLVVLAQPISNRYAIDRTGPDGGVVSLANLSMLEQQLTLMLSPTSASLITSGLEAIVSSQLIPRPLSSAA